MEIVYHRLITRDLRDALRYYDQEGGSALGDRFFADVEETAGRAIENPNHFHFASGTLRRARLRMFPYHFLFREHDSIIQFLVLWHDRRHPNYGLRRKL